MLWYAIKIQDNKLWIETFETNDFKKAQEVMKKSETHLLLNQALFEMLKEEVKKTDSK